MRERIVGYDIARAFAVFGMVLVNYKVVMAVEGTGAAWLETCLSALTGKAAATFVVLAGIGVSLSTSKAREGRNEPDIRRAKYRLLLRAFFLLALGLIYVPLWPGDILHFYGVYLLVASAAFLWSTRSLWLGAILVTAAFMALLLAFDYEREWNWNTLEYRGFWTSAGMIRHLCFNGFHPVFPWIGFLFVGMWLGRLNLRDPLLRRKVFWSGSLLLVGGSIASALLGRVAKNLLPNHLLELGVLVETSPMPPTPLYMVVGLGAALAMITASIELEERFSGWAWIEALAATGQLSLTMYMAHVVIGMGFLDAISRLENQSLAFATTAACVFSLLGMVFSVMWLRRFPRGPLEMLMRRITG